MKPRPFVLPFVLALLGLPVTSVIARAAPPSKVFVFNSNDTGPGSFRDAIDRANVNPSISRVEFLWSVSTIVLHHTVFFTGVQDLAIDGNRAILDGTHTNGAALVTTGGQFRMRVAPTSDRQKLLDAAAAFTADGGGNSVIRTMVEADSRLLKSADGRRGVLVVVTTDRGDYPNDNTVDIYNRFMPEFGRRGGRAHAVVIRPSGGGLISAVLENLSTNTGGFRETITIASALPAVMKKLTAFVAADQ